MSDSHTSPPLSLEVSAYVSGAGVLTAGTDKLAAAYNLTSHRGSSEKADMTASDHKRSSSSSKKSHSKWHTGVTLP